MWAIVGILTISVIITLYEVPKLVKAKQKKEIVVFFGLLLIATTLTILEVRDINMPNPLVGIQMIYEPISTFVLQFLKP